MSHDLGMGEDFVNCGCREAFVRLLTNTDDSNSPSTNASRYGLHYQFDVLPVSKADWYFLSLFLLTEIILPPSPNFKRGKHGQKGPAVHFVKNVSVPLCILYTHCIDPSEYLFLFPRYGQKSKIFPLFTNFLCQPQKKLGDLLRAQF